jgi:hypothetical protein
MVQSLLSQEIALEFDHPIQMFLALAIVACVILAALTMFVAAQAAPSTIPSVDLNAAPSHSQIVQTMLQ